jgi:hypothetical protein
VQGRFDHFGFDGKKLFVAALDNNSVEVIGFSAWLRVKSISGISNPRGMACVVDAKRRLVASSKGQLRICDDTNFDLVKEIDFRGGTSTVCAMTPGPGFIFAVSEIRAVRRRGRDLEVPDTGRDRRR